MWASELIGYLARTTGWSLEYIGQLPARTAMGLYSEIRYQRAVEEYRMASYFAMCICTWANAVSKRHHRTSDFIGREPREPKHKGVTIMAKQTVFKLTLSDGSEYEVGPLTATAMDEVETKFNKAFVELFGGDNVRVGVITYTLWCVLKRNYPDLTEEDFGQRLTAKVITDNYLEIVGHLMS